MIEQEHTVCMQSACSLHACAATAVSHCVTCFLLLQPSLSAHLLCKHSSLIEIKDGVDLITQGRLSERRLRESAIICQVLSWTAVHLDECHLKKIGYLAPTHYQYGKMIPIDMEYFIWYWMETFSCIIRHHWTASSAKYEFSSSPHRLYRL